VAFDNKPDASIMTTDEFDYDTLNRCLRELAFLNKGIRIILEDERTDQKKEFCYEGWAGRIRGIPEPA